MPYGITATDRNIGIDYDRMRKYRLKRTQDQMKKDGIDLLITWDPYSIRYITGAYVTVPNRPASAQCVIVPVEGDPWAFVLASFDPFALQRSMPWMKNKVQSALGSIKFAKSTKELPKYPVAIKQIMEENKMSNDIMIGLDGCVGELIFTELLREMGLNNYCNATKCMFDARAIKNQDEIACLRYACKMADAAFADIADAIRPGIRENDLVGIGMKKLYEMGADECMEFVCASGPRTNPLFIDFTDRAVGPGELICVDINGASFQGYKTCYYRTFSCGKASQQQKDAYKRCRDEMYDAIKLLKPGVTTSEVIAPWPKDSTEFGYESWQHCRGFYLGHGLGIGLQEGPEMFWNWNCGTNEVLQEGMVLAIETYYGPKGSGFGIRLEEDVVITKDGYEVITTFPVDGIIECWR